MRGDGAPGPGRSSPPTCWARSPSRSSCPVARGGTSASVTSPGPPARPAVRGGRRVAVGLLDLAKGAGGGPARALGGAGPCPLAPLAVVAGHCWPVYSASAAARGSPRPWARALVLAPGALGVGSGSGSPRSPCHLGLGLGRVVRCCRSPRRHPRARRGPRRGPPARGRPGFGAGPHDGRHRPARSPGAPRSAAGAAGNRT
jgi:hypothetical protein